MERFYDIVKGAALIAGVEYEIHPKSDFYNKIPVLKLNQLLMENAELAGAPRLSPPRERTGSTDFGNVMYEIPGSCIRVAFVPEGTASHSQEFLDAGKSQAARDCVLYGANPSPGPAGTDRNSGTDGGSEAGICGEQEKIQIARRGPRGTGNPCGVWLRRGFSRVWVLFFPGPSAIRFQYT